MPTVKKMGGFQIMTQFESNRMLRSPLTALLIALALLAVTMQPVPAQKGTVIRKRVEFARGRNSATFKGSAEWGTSYIYLVRARAGQAMTVEIKGAPGVTIRTPDPNHVFNIDQGDGEDKRWSGDLPATGEYKIIVSHTIDGVVAAPYTLKITIQ
jgi:hypothetical protein